jgi:hypothetical protein
MENDELKKLIKQSIREVFYELYAWPENERDHYKYPNKDFLHRFDPKLRRGTDELGSQVDRLSMIVSKFESWSSSSGCKYEASEIAEVKRLLTSIDAKLP